MTRTKQHYKKIILPSGWVYDDSTWTFSGPNGELVDAQSFMPLANRLMKELDDFKANKLSQPHA